MATGVKVLRIRPDKATRVGVLQIRLATGVDMLQIKLFKARVTPVWMYCVVERGVWRACSWPWGRKKRRFRTIPGVTKQFKLLLRRAGVKWVRGWSYKFIDMLLFVGAALVVGEPCMDQCSTCMTGCNTVTVIHGSFVHDSADSEEELWQTDRPKPKCCCNVHCWLRKSSE